MNKKLSIDADLYFQIREIAQIKGIATDTLFNEIVQDYLYRTKKQDDDPKDCRFTFIDLFAGIGGMRLGFEAVGGKCVFTSEWDKYSQKTYYANFGDLPKGDITKIHERDIPNHDILVAGFPCQPFSVAGVAKKNSLGRDTGFKDKTQGTLFFDVCRILNEKRPKAFLLENVKNLMSHDKGNTWKIIQESLRELNYDFYYKIIDGQDFVPQHRERIFIVGFDKERYGDEIKFDFDLKKPELKPRLRDILDRQVSDKYILTDHLWDYLQSYAEKHRKLGHGFGYGMPDLDGPSRTLSARYHKDGAEILINRGEGVNPRRLTPRECARLQGFPEYFKIVVSDSQAYKEFGNSVVVPVIKELARLISNKLMEMKSIDMRVINKQIPKLS